MLEDNFAKTIQNLSEIEFPDNLHGKIMRKLAFLQFRTPFLVVVSLLSLNLLFSAWSIWIKLAGSASFSTFRLILEGFEWNLSSAQELFQTAQELFPLGLMFTFTINILLVVYLVYILKAYKNYSPKI